MNIAQWVHRAGKTFPDFAAVGLGPDTVHNYRQLSHRVAGLAAGLVTTYQLQPGDRVALVMKNVPQYIESLFAIWHAGMTAVPVNAKLHPRELQFILQKADIALTIATPEIAQGLTAISDKPVLCCADNTYETLTGWQEMPLKHVNGDDLAWLFFTSGTTGKPKGAMLTHRNLTAMTLNYFSDFDAIQPGDTIFHPAPLSHGAGLWMLPHICAAACNVLPASTSFNPTEIFSDLQHWKNVAMFAAPTMVRRLTLHQTDACVENLKLIIYGGAPMYITDCIAALDRFGPRLAQLYGQGESPMTITHLPRHMLADRSHPDWKTRLGTVGIPDSCMSVAIANENGDHLPTGQIGEIICRGDPVMAGYWRDDRATASTLKNGWLHTGDVGHFNENGFLTLTDRSKDLIISGGSNIYPREIEEVLLTADGVEEVSVVSRPDPDWGEIVVAYVVGSADRDSLEAHCLANIARFKRPKIYRFIDQLPKNNYGKILKTVLRDMETADKNHI
jgi:long-chain acyl-CoA synthetase